MKKIIALYLPQYHSIPENDAWWGKGYTEWTAVKNAKPLFKSHRQPRIPLGNNYYDLSEENGATWKWQAEIAKAYGVYGFGIYHYWFGNGVQLLEKPTQILLQHKDIKINFCFVWANESWTRTWYGLDREILANQVYGGPEEWENHFNYLLPFFLDDRYIKIDGKPMICIYRSAMIDNLAEMLDCWRRMAKLKGLPGLHVVVCNSNAPIESRVQLIDAFYNFEPTFSMKYNYSFIQRERRKLRILIRTIANGFRKNKILERIENTRTVYRCMEKNFKNGYLKPTYLGLFPSWDNTPRRAYKGLYFSKSSPSLFKEMLIKTLNNTESDGFIFVNAWNEWGEGCYLEPDCDLKFSYLEAIKEAIENE